MSNHLAFAGRDLPQAFDEALILAGDDVTLAVYAPAAACSGLYRGCLCGSVYVLA